MSPLSCPFGAGLYQDDGSSTRLNIEFGQLECMEAIFRGIDEQLAQAAITAKDSLWPKGLTPKQVRENYTSPLKEREGYSTTLRCKIGTEKCRCWSWEGKKNPAARLEGQGLPGLLTHPTPVPLVHVSQMGSYIPGDASQGSGAHPGMPLVICIKTNMISISLKFAFVRSAIPSPLKGNYATS